MKIEIDDEVWNLYRKSWALLGVRDHYKLVKMLEDQMWEESSTSIESSRRQLIDDTPEAYVQREIGLEDERRDKTRRFIDSKGCLNDVDSKSSEVSS